MFKIDIQQELLKRKVLVDILVYPKNKDGLADMSQQPKVHPQMFCIQNNLGTYFMEEGRYYSHKMLVNEAGLHWSDHSKPIICCDEPTAATSFHSTAMYKYDPYTAKDVCRGTSRVLGLVGSSGTPTLQGSHGVDIAACINAEEMLFVTMPWPQR